MSDAVRGETTTTEPSRAQAQHARRVAESRATIPHLTLRASADVTGLPGELVAHVAAAAARALTAHPALNGAYRDARFEAYGRVNVAVLVEGDGIAAPVLFDADTLDVAAAAEQRTALETRVREGSSTSPELRGATFSVWAADVDAFEAPVPTGQAAILAVGAPRERAAVVDGEPAVRTLAELTLSVDHRVVLAASGAAFLAAVAAGLRAS